MVHVNTGRDRVTERHLGIHFHILQSSFVAVLVGCEGIVVTAWSGEDVYKRQLEYYIADNALSRIAAALGKKEDARLFHERSLGYKHYYCKEYGTFRPILPNGEFYAPFDPRQGENFEPNPGFHEGCAWNYTFYVPHDVKGLARLMGGKKPFVDKLQRVFDEEMCIRDRIIYRRDEPKKS